MELFQRAKAVRLRSHNDKYLLAEDDEEHVYQNRKGTTRQARWEVELVQDGQSHVRFKSCYAKYLSASNEPFLLGVTGRKVLQAAPGRRLDSSLEWEPIRDGFQVKLKTRYGHFLRANGGLPPWRNSVTHDIPHLHHDWVLWEVDIVEVRNYIPPVVSPAPAESVESSPSFSRHSGAAESVESSPSFSKQESFSSSSSTSPQKSLSTASSASHYKADSRSIHYVIANTDGYVQDGAEEFAFTFHGKSVEELTQKLEEETELSHIIVCSRNPVNGKLYPLRLGLPPNKTNINVVVVLASSKVARTFSMQGNPS